MAGLLVSGLFLIHYRVTIFFVVFCLVWLVLWGWYQRRDPKKLLPGLRNVLGALAVGAVLVGPWLSRLGTDFILPLNTFPARLTGSQAYNAMPWSLVWSGSDRVLLPMAGAGLLLALWRKKRDLIAIGLWVPAAFVLVNPSLWGGRPTWLVTNSSLVISLYLPVAVLAGYFTASFAHAIEKRVTQKWQLAWRTALGCILAIVALRGAWTSVNMVNPSTVLVTESDLQAFEWIKAEVSTDAVFLVNSRPWQLGMYMGTDAGWWIPLLTGRQVTLPPVLYTMGSPDYVKRVDRIAELTQQASPDETRMLNLLHDVGVTHVYVGARGGPLALKSLLESAYFRRVYSSGEVWIFQFLG